jgi:hypothetical protein
VCVCVLFITICMPLGFWKGCMGPERRVLPKRKQGRSDTPKLCAECTQEQKINISSSCQTSRQSTLTIDLAFHSSDKIRTMNMSCSSSTLGPSKHTQVPSSESVTTLSTSEICHPTSTGMKIGEERFYRRACSLLALGALRARVQAGQNTLHSNSVCVVARSRTAITVILHQPTSCSSQRGRCWSPRRG